MISNLAAPFLSGAFLIALFATSVIQAQQPTAIGSVTLRIDSEDRLRNGTPPSAAPQERPKGPSISVKITDSLILAIPLEYERFAIYKGRDVSKPIPKIGENASAQFDFFLPDFHGYTLRSDKDEFDPNKVEIAYLVARDPKTAELGAGGSYPPNVIRRVLEDLANPRDFEDVYGLRCYQARILKDRTFCYGRRSESEYILLHVMIPPFSPGMVNPQMFTSYFSTQYGGVEIYWRTNARNFPRWREIDTQIWKFIDAWNVAHNSPSDAKP